MDMGMQWEPEEQIATGAHKAPRQPMGGQHQHTWDCADGAEHPFEPCPSRVSLHLKKTQMHIDNERLWIRIIRILHITVPRAPRKTHFHRDCLHKNDYPIIVYSRKQRKLEEIKQIDHL